jgi:hypothetical protein
MRLFPAISAGAQALSFQRRPMSAKSLPCFGGDFPAPHPAVLRARGMKRKHRARKRPLFPQPPRRTFLDEEFRRRTGHFRIRPGDGQSRPSVLGDRRHFPNRLGLYCALLSVQGVGLRYFRSRAAVPCPGSGDSYRPCWRPATRMTWPASRK